MQRPSHAEMQLRHSNNKELYEKKSTFVSRYSSRKIAEQVSPAPRGFKSNCDDWRPIVAKLAPIEETRAKNASPVASGNEEATELGLLLLLSKSTSLIVSWRGGMVYLVTRHFSEDMDSNRYAFPGPSVMQSIGKWYLANIFCPTANISVLSLYIV